ncbi:MAG TPA: glucosamine-6-phosphate deaminase [Steroidobacteraceae bacterium]|nr:glucosamine-6-phosphate deaminase [Steroidobacteraceae bacterium]
MQLVWCETPATFNALAADKVISVLSHKPSAVIALPTGQTPVGLYSELRTRAAARELPVADARWFNLDEYVGLDGTHSLSYAKFVRTHLLDALDVPESHIRLLRGNAEDLQAECHDYDEAIARAGGLDLAILGLGANGHIAFNEPGSPWDSATHVVSLSALTRSVNARLHPDAVIPEKGITMGVATLRAARRILLLVSGESKRKALQALRRGIADRAWPVTSLVDHPDLTVLSDAQLR